MAKDEGFYKEEITFSKSIEGHNVINIKYVPNQEYIVNALNELNKKQLIIEPVEPTQLNLQPLQPINFAPLAIIGDAGIPSNDFDPALPDNQ